jgi:hypothetical protein
MNMPYDLYVSQSFPVVLPDRLDTQEGTCRGCIKRHRWSILLPIPVHFSKGTCLSTLKLLHYAVLSPKDTLLQAPFISSTMDALPHAGKVLPYSRRPFFPFVVEKGKEEEKKRKKEHYLLPHSCISLISFLVFLSLLRPPSISPLTAAITLSQSYQPFCCHCFYFFHRFGRALLMASFYWYQSSLDGVVIHVLWVL